MKKLVLAALTLSMASASAACAQPTTANAPPEHGRHGGGMFGDADANHDGTITRAEWDASRTARFTRDDKNSDGSLSADERPQWGGRGDHGGPPPAGASPAGAPPRVDHGGGMRNADSNGDGLISRAEYDAQSAAMFSRFDSNGDGSISADELQAMRDRRGGGGGGDGGGQ